MSESYSARKVIKTLIKMGFSQISQNGSHIKLRELREGKLCTAIVPNHKEIAQ